MSSYWVSEWPHESVGVVRACLQGRVLLRNKASRMCMLKKHNVILNNGLNFHGEERQPCRGFLGILVEGSRLGLVPK